MIAFAVIAAAAGFAIIYVAQKLILKYLVKDSGGPRVAAGNESVEIQNSFNIIQSDRTNQTSQRTMELSNRTVILLPTLLPPETTKQKDQEG